MTYCRNERFSCPNCGRVFRARICEIIQGDSDPLAKEEIIRGTFFFHECPACHEKICIHRDMTYTDSKLGVCIVLAYTDDFYLDTISELKQIRENGDSADLKIYNTAKASRFRIVRSERELSEKVLIFEKGYDDRIIEILRKRHLDQMKKKDPGIDELFFSIGKFEDGSEGMAFLPFKNDTAVESLSHISKQEYDIAYEEYKDLLESYHSHNFRINRKWIDEFLSYAEEIEDDYEPEFEFDGEDTGEQIQDEIMEFLYRRNDDSAFVRFGEENWEDLLEHLLDHWYEDIAEEKPSLDEIDDLFGNYLRDLIYDLEMCSWNEGRHAFRARLCQDVLEQFDLKDDPATFHDMKRFHMESLEKSQSLSAAKDYLKQWQKEEPGSPYVIGTIIQFYLTHDEKEKAIELAEKYINMEMKKTGDTWLYDACENLYSDLGDRKKLALIERLRKRNRI